MTVEDKFLSIRKNALFLYSVDMVGSCTCMTKTPEIEYHKETCKYRMLREAYEGLLADLRVIEEGKK
jgi:hypothetical protein